MTKVAKNAFESDSDVVTFTAGANLEEIEESAFYYCDELKTQTSHINKCLKQLKNKEFLSI